MVCIAKNIYYLNPNREHLPSPELNTGKTAMSTNEKQKSQTKLSAFTEALVGWGKLSTRDIGKEHHVFSEKEGLVGSRWEQHMGSCHFQHGGWRKRDISTGPPGARGLLSGSQTRESIKMEKECRALCREHAWPLGAVEAAVSGGEWRDGE